MRIFQKWDFLIFLCWWKFRNFQTDFHQLHYFKLFKNILFCLTLILPVRWHRSPLFEDYWVWYLQQYRVIFTYFTLPSYIFHMLSIGVCIRKINISFSAFVNSLTFFIRFSMSKTFLISRKRNKETCSKNRFIPIINVNADAVSLVNIGWMLKFFEVLLKTFLP